MQIHRNIIFKMTKHNISRSSNQNNQNYISQAEVLNFTEVIKLFALEIIFFL